MTKRDFIELHYVLNTINLILLFLNLFLISLITVIYIYLITYYIIYNI